MTKYSAQWFKSNYTGHYNYSSIGGQTSEIGSVITKLESIRDQWNEVVNSNETFYNEFLTQIDEIITNLNTYKSFLETKGADIQQLAEWTD